VFVKLLQYRNLVHELSATFNVEEHTLSGEFGLDLIAGPCNQLELGDVDLVQSVEELWEPAHLLVLLLSQGCLDDLVEDGQNSRHVLLCTILQ